MRTARSLPYGGIFVQGGGLCRGGLFQGDPLPVNRITDKQV